jgi:hypothetical protein
LALLALHDIIILRGKGLPNFIKKIKGGENKLWQQM